MIANEASAQMCEGSSFYQMNQIMSCGNASVARLYDSLKSVKVKLWNKSQMIMRVKFSN